MKKIITNSLLFAFATGLSAMFDQYNGPHARQPYNNREFTDSSTRSNSRVVKKEEPLTLAQIQVRNFIQKQDNYNCAKK